MSRTLRAALAPLLALPGLAQAAEVNGAGLSIWWSLPFAGMLLSIALMPLLLPKLWHHHFGKITAAWSLAFLLPFALQMGPNAAGSVVAHTLVAEYIPFIALLVALFTAAGGIFVRGNLHGSPGMNVLIMAVGSVLASIMGTTGASMLMIRPLIRANDNRKHCAHVVVFFIFTVSNAGGSLTPLGDPPLFLGFLKGVSFFWTVGHILPETLFLIGSLLVIFWVIDSWYYRREGVQRADPTPDTPRLGIEGGINFLPLAAVVGLVLMSGLWKPGVELHLFGQVLGLEQVVRDVALVLVTLASLWLTP
jgi:Na+/H+ antiporter NhaD/arsenite permease-like protein